MKNILKNGKPGSSSILKLLLCSVFPIYRNHNKFRLVHLFLYSVVVLSSAIFFTACKAKKQEVITSKEDSTSKGDTYYTCSMHTQVHEDKPGKCPVCKMDLIPVKKSTTQVATGEIELSAQQIQLGNIQVDTIRAAAIGNQMILTATLNFDQQNENSISSRVMGRIEKLYFKNIGDYVSKGAKLFDVYSEELNNAKQEYLLALEKQKTLDNSVIDFAQLVQAARNKLQLWGMSEAQINDLAENKKATPLTSFYSNVNGYVISLDVKEGDYVMEGGTVVRLADLSTLWAEAQVYSSQLASIEKNAEAIVQFPDMPEKEIKGKIKFMNPEINPETRINLVRVVVPNSAKQFKPGMQAYVIIKSKKHNSLSLPMDAVIRDSKGASVWVQTGDRKFKYKMVEVGMEDNDLIEIKSGLQSGDVVVISGAYLINSEYIFTKGSNPMVGMDMSKMKM